MGRIGIWEIIGIMLVLSLVFGTKKLPEMGHIFGETLNNFKKASKSDTKGD